MTAGFSDGAAYADITAQYAIVEQIMGEFDVSLLVVLFAARAQRRDTQLGDDTDEEDPFAEIDEGYEEDDLEANLQRDKYARLTSAINQLVDELNPDAPDFQIRDACDELVICFCLSVKSRADDIVARAESSISCQIRRRCKDIWCHRMGCLHSWKFWRGRTYHERSS